MTDTSAPNGAPNGAPEATSDDNAAAQSGIRILAQFVRDFSFENPLAPDSLRAGAAQPQIDMGVEMNARGRPDGLFEVDLKLSARALRDEQAVFHVEVVYGGLFHIDGVAEADLEPVLLIECPRFLFPYARRLISDVTAEGGFPPFLIDPIDFAGVYAARKAQAEAGGVVGNA
jgi:preprotein translocase subunit SecB